MTVSVGNVWRMWCVNDVTLYWLHSSVIFHHFRLAPPKGSSLSTQMSTYGPNKCASCHQQIFIFYQNLHYHRITQTKWSPKFPYCANDSQKLTVCVNWFVKKTYYPDICSLHSRRQQFSVCQISKMCCHYEFIGQYLGAGWKSESEGLLWTSAQIKSSFYQHLHKLAAQYLYMSQDQVSL